jgi:hypothetical protein
MTQNNSGQEHQKGQQPVPSLVQNLLNNTQRVLQTNENDRGSGVSNLTTSGLGSGAGGVTGQLVSDGLVNRNLGAFSAENIGANFGQLNRPVNFFGNTLGLALPLGSENLNVNGLGSYGVQNDGRTDALGQGNVSGPSPAVMQGLQPAFGDNNWGNFGFLNDGLGQFDLNANAALGGFGGVNGPNVGLNAGFVGVNALNAGITAGLGGVNGSNYGFNAGVNGLNAGLNTGFGGVNGLNAGINGINAGFGGIN